MLARMGSELDNLRFASDATWTGIAGILALLFAAYALVAERRRFKRKHVDQVGWVPWTKVFFAALLVGVTLVMFALKGWHTGK
jgi:hypothetical protein